MYKSYEAWDAFQRCLLVGMGSSVIGPPQGWFSATHANWLNRLVYENMELLFELFVLSFLLIRLCLNLNFFLSRQLSFFGRILDSPAEQEPDDAGLPQPAHPRPHHLLLQVQAS